MVGARNRSYPNDSEADSHSEAVSGADADFDSGVDSGEDSKADSGVDSEGTRIPELARKSQSAPESESELAPESESVLVLISDVLRNEISPRISTRMDRLQINLGSWRLSMQS